MLGVGAGEVGLLSPEMSGEGARIVDPAGATSRLTAAARARESVRDDRWFDDRFAARLAGPVGFEALDRHDAGLAAAGRASPNPVFAIRTRFFDDFLLVQTTQAGVRQVVLIAAGLDCRAFRLAWPSGTRVFELDQAEVLAYKDALLRAQQAAPACHRTEVAVDLREPWIDRLLDEGYHMGEPGVWLAEGLTFYLSEAAVRNLLSDIAQVAGAGDAFGCDFVMEPPPGVEAATGYATNDPMPLLRACGWKAERYDYDHESERLGRDWPSPIRPLGYIAISHRTR